MKIYKYPLDGTGLTTLPNFPKRHELLHVGLQDGKPFLWALVDEHATDAERQPLQILCVGTGWTMPAGPFDHITTLQDGAFVWHFFAAK